MLSAVLLVADYSDYSNLDKVNQLLMSIEAKARPESLIASLLGYTKGRKKSNLPRLMTLNLIKHGGDFEEIKLTDRVVLLSLWANPQPDRKDLVVKLQGINESIKVIDVLTESDTLHWHETIADESWPHYWAPGGPLEQGIQLLGITSMPWYAVTDSTGLIVYSGPSLDAATKKATDIIK